MTVKWPPATLPLAGTESVPALQGGKLVGVPSSTFGGAAVTSVGLVMPSNFTVTNSPVTGSGNLTVTWAPEAPNLVLAGPLSGSGPPTFRALTAADLPGGVDGTVTSVGLAMPSIFTVANSPVTTSGVLTATFNNQAQGLVLASPAAATGQPTFRALAATDIPSLSGTYLPLAGGALTGDLTVGGNLSINGVGGINAVGPLGVGGTITGADIAISASKPARQVWAAPVGTTGVPSFRLLVATDIPSLSYLPLSGGNLSGSLTINSTLNTTGLATLGDLAVSAAKTASFALIAPGAGGAPAWRQIAATDISGLSGGGSVSSVGLTMPGDFTVANSPVTTAGTLAVTRNSQAAHQVLAAPAGGAGVPTFRLLQTTDIPSLSGTYLPLAGGTVTGATTFQGSATTLLVDNNASLPANIPAAAGTLEVVSPAGANGNSYFYGVGAPHYVNNYVSPGTAAAPTPPTAGYFCGGYIGGAWNGSAFASGMGMFVVATENWTATANGMEITWYTTPVGTTNNAPRMGLSSDGSLYAGPGNSTLAANATGGFMCIPNIAGPPTGTPNIRVRGPAALVGQAPAVFDPNANRLWLYNGTSWQGQVKATTDLSDVTGVITFTPTITAATPGDLTATYLQQFGFYIKIGILYFVNIVLTFTPTYTTASGNLRFVGMPVGTSGQFCMGSGAFQRLPIATGSQLTPFVAPSAGYGGVITSVNNAAQTVLAITAIPSGTANVTIQFTGMYY